MRKGLVQRREFKNGKISKIILLDYDKGTATYEYSYPTPFITRCLFKYPGNKTRESYTYQYDPKNHELVYAIGLEGKKVIYKESSRKELDTTITATFYNTWNLTASEERRHYFSKDSLYEFLIETTDNGSSRFSRKQYNSQRQLTLEIDSGAYHFEKSTYQYDSIGRLVNKIDQQEGHSYTTEYQYEPFTTTIIEYGLSTNVTNESAKIIEETTTQYFDDDHSLVFEVTKKYFKAEGIAYLPADSLSPTKPTTEKLAEPDETIQKFYKNNRLIKTVRILGQDTRQTYTITYDK